MGYLLQTTDLTYRYNSKQKKPSLRDVSIGITEGRRTVILGANGAGKSTLFYSLNGIFKPVSGQVLYRGEPLDYSREGLVGLRSDIAIVVQNPDEQIFSSTVEEDVAFGPMNMGLPGEEVERRICDSLFKVGMTEYRKRPTIQLSYGQRKRVSIAGALAVEPKVLILDEPTAGLDPQMSMEVLELVDQLVNSGTTVIISTHDVDLAYAWADEIHVLRNGSLIYSGEPEPFFSDRESVAMAGLARPHTFSVNSSVQTILGSEESPYPRTQSQMLAKMAPVGAKAGSIRLIPVDGEDIPATEGLVGIYGVRARRLFHDRGLAADFRFNAVESGCIAAMQGRDVTLYCDSDMVLVVRERIEGLARFGCCPEVVL